MKHSINTKIATVAALAATACLGITGVAHAVPAHPVSAHGPAVGKTVNCLEQIYECHDPYIYGSVTSLAKYKW